MLVEVSLGGRFALELEQLDGSFVVAGVLLFGSPHLAAQALYLRRSDRNVVLEAAHDAPDLILDLRLPLRHLLTNGLPGRVSGVEGSRQFTVLYREPRLLPAERPDLGCVDDIRTGVIR